MSSIASASGVEQKLRGGTLAKQRAEETLKEANIAPGETVVADKKESGKFGVPIDGLQTNIHRLDILQKIKIYRYEVEVLGVTRNGREVPLTAPTGSDYRTFERRMICLGMYRLFLRQVTTENYYYYDLQRLLYSIKDMQIPKEGKKFEFTAQQFVEVINLENMNEFQQFKLNIKPFPEGSQITLADFSYLVKKLEGIDRSSEQFLDIATSQNALNNEEEFTHYAASQYYFMNPSAFGFGNADCPYFSSNCSFLGIGLHKGVRPISASDGKLTYGMIVQCKKSPFHENQDACISQKAFAIMGDDIHRASIERIRERVEPMIKGIWVETIHRHQKFEIVGVALETSITEIIDFGDVKESVQRYFERRYNIRLEHPNLPLIIRKQGRETTKYPMELCRVFDNQRVKEKQQTSMAIQQMIRLTAVPPAKVIQQNKQVRASLGLDGPNQLTDAAGIKFNPTPIEVKARVLPPPELEFGRNTTEKPRPDATWKGFGQYLIPAKCTKWMAVVVTDSSMKNRINQNQFRTFISQYCQRLAQMGMLFAPPEFRFPELATFVMKNFMEELLRDGYEFVLIAHPDNADAIHHEMKFYEQKSEVVTQGLKIPTVINVVEKRQNLTLANIVHKTNVKMGGINYAPLQRSMPLPELTSIFGKETLFIGFAMNHPGGGFDPMKTDSDLALIAGGNGNGHGHNGNGNGHDGNGNDDNGNGGNGNGNEDIGGNGGNGHANGDEGNGNGNGSHHKLNAPSVVGFSANIGSKHFFEFVGDYVYQYALRDEKVDVIADTVKRCVNQFREREHEFPKRIVVLRNGCAEGAFPNILKYEVPLMKQGLGEVGCQAKITVLVINKLQQLRLFPKQINPHAKPFEQNIQPGTVVDSGIVHPILTEFYLNSHRAIQGTAAVPRYNCLLDENKLSMDVLQLVMHYLCFGHQIVYSPTSLPSPVFIAEEYAKRGRNNYNVWASKNELEGIKNHKDLTNMLSMENSTYLKYMRPNA